MKNIKSFKQFESKDSIKDKLMRGEQISDEEKDSILNDEEMSDDSDQERIEKTEGELRYDYDSMNKENQKKNKRKKDTTAWPLRSRI